MGASLLEPSFSDKFQQIFIFGFISGILGDLISNFFVQIKTHTVITTIAGRYIISRPIFRFSTTKWTKGIVMLNGRHGQNPVVNC